MPEAWWVQGLVTVGVGAVSGGITNAVAVWMLFHPYEPRGVGPLKIQGAIPKNRARLARSIARTVGQRLLSEDDLARQLTSPDLRDAFEGALDGVIRHALDTPRGSLRTELPPGLLVEIERALDPVAAQLARRLAALAGESATGEALERAIDLEAWVGDVLARPELEATVRRLLTAQRDALLHDERPLVERLPAPVVDALEREITDYLPVAVERLGTTLADPATRDRLRPALRAVLDRAIQELRAHERLLAKLVVTERRLDAVLDAIGDGGLSELTTTFATPEFRERLGAAVREAVTAFLRLPLADRLWALGADRLDALERAAADAAVRALRAPEARAWVAARTREAIRVAAGALDTDAGRERLVRTARAALDALLDLPIGRPGDVLPADAPRRLRAALATPLWDWMRAQVPVVVSQLAVEEMVERKVLGFSVERMEEIIRGVTERELRLIVQLGYVLGALVGLVAWGVNLLFG